MTVTSVDLELALNRVNTERFIDADPTWISLYPVAEVWVAGSKRMVKADTPRPAQKFKVIYPGGDQVVTTTDGTTKKLDFILVGLFDAVVHVGDTWTETSQTYRIESIEPFNGYETKAHGITIGGNPSHG